MPKEKTAKLRFKCPVCGNLLKATNIEKIIIVLPKKE